MSVSHKYHSEANKIISNDALPLDTEEDQKKYIEQEVVSDPFGTNPIICHMNMQKKNNGKIGGILSMKKKRNSG